ncbi:aminotransferase class V-fold PLP-dependent enzyme [Aquipuribacter nitratireducens]|uniref:Aminotransferase class V-fold PLP-dependent enzyme n=1 Tax=Aquipuribacter nitratireducens TaxID=650104 RepID=A0ABW0GIQ9_9MICO
MSHPGLGAWDAVPGYLNASTLGLPPRRTVAALRAAVDDWQGGRASAPDYDADVDASRRLFADLVGVPPGWVAVGSQVSVMVGEVAAHLPDRSKVVGVEGDFGSVLGPVEAQARRGVELVTVPLDRLPDEIARARPDAVVFSLAQSADGRLAAADDVVVAAADIGALTVCDTTQATGWLPVDAGRWDVTVCSAYKWLCAPRGAAFLTVRPEASERLSGHNAGWYAGDDVWASVYGPGLRLARDARRFDVSPVWLAWVGARTSLEAVLEVPAEVRHRHGPALADQLRTLLGESPQGRPVVSVDDPNGGLVRRLVAAGCSVASRAGRARLSFHLWNDSADVARAAQALLTPA